MTLMNGDNGELQKPVQNQNAQSTVPRAELAPDQPVQLRPSEPTVIAQAAQPIQAAPIQFAPEQNPAASNNSFGALTQDEYSPAYPVDIAPQDASQDPLAATNVPEVTWTASEFIAHPKNTNWYLALVGVTVVILVGAWLIGHDIITSLAIVICAILFGTMAARQPRQLEYSLGTNGVTIGPKFYPFKDFRSFAVIPEGAFSSIDFMPLKRFAPILSIYYDPEYEPRVRDLLAEHLPSAVHKRTMVDELMHRIRF